MRTIDKSIHKFLDRNRAVKDLKKCMAEFTSFHVLNYILHEEALKAFDMIEENKSLDRFQVKRLKNTCHSLYKQYTDKLRRDLTPDAYYLLQDYCNLCYGTAEKRLIHLCVACDNYLANQPTEHRNRKILAQCMVFRVMSNIIHDTWHSFFKTYKDHCGLDFSGEFAYADLSPFIVTFEKMADLLAQGNPSIDFGDDRACLAAWQALKNEINREGFFDSAAKTAINFSPTLRVQYQEDMARIEEQRQEQAHKELTARLGEKYKVTSLKQ